MSVLEVPVAERGEESRVRTPSACTRIFPNKVPKAPKKSCKSWVKGSPKVRSSAVITTLEAARTSALA